MEVSISAMCEHLRVPTCLVSCGFVISRDVQHHLQLSMAEDDLVTFHPTAGVVFYGLMVFFQRTSGGIQTGLAVVWFLRCHVCHIGFQSSRPCFHSQVWLTFTDSFIVST
jgi:hypothetical protein